jgi:phosphoglycerate dehydrogenase-like enzyme
VEVIVHPNAQRRIRDRIRQLTLREPPTFVCLEDDGRLTRKGRTVDSARRQPDAFWLSMDFILAGRFDQTFDMILGQPSIRWVQTCNAGLDHGRYAEVAARGIRISNSDAQAVAIAEYTMAQVLSVYHPIDAQRAAQRRRAWVQTPFEEISRTTWLIVGYGHIGSAIGERARAFGARVIAVRRRPGRARGADETGRSEDLPALLPRADVVVLACPLTEATRRLANRRFFARMKPGAVIVNIARGGLVDDAALLDALDSEKVRAAILDVVTTEPPPRSSRFWVHPAVRMTAHTSFAGNGTMPRGDDLFLENLARYTSGRRLRNEVDLRSLR